MEKLHHISSSDYDRDCTLVLEQTPTLEKFCGCGGPAYHCWAPGSLCGTRTDGSSKCGSDNEGDNETEIAVTSDVQVSCYRIVFE